MPATQAPERDETKINAYTLRCFCWLLLLLRWSSLSSCCLRVQPKGLPTLETVLPRCYIILRLKSVSLFSPLSLGHLANECRPGLRTEFEVGNGARSFKRTTDFAFVFRVCLNSVYQ